MSWIDEFEPWIGTTLAAAVFAFIGFVGRGLIDRRRAKQAAEAGSISDLKALSKLLWASKKIFEIQCDHRNRLYDMLESNHTIVRDDMGYEEVFTNLYDEMSGEERKLHRHIRAITENSMLHINQKIQDLLNKIEIKNLPVKSITQEKLSEKLRILDLHLTLWLAKYQYWIPEDPKHALVYMADEEAHGVGFPK